MSGPRSLVGVLVAVAWLPEAAALVGAARPWHAASSAMRAPAVALTASTPWLVLPQPSRGRQDQQQQQRQQQQQQQQRDKEETEDLVIRTANPADALDLARLCTDSFFGTHDASDGPLIFLQRGVIWGRVLQQVVRRLAIDEGRECRLLVVADAERGTMPGQGIATYTPPFMRAFLADNDGVPDPAQAYAANFPGVPPAHEGERAPGVPRERRPRVCGRAQSSSTRVATGRRCGRARSAACRTPRRRSSTRSCARSSAGGPTSSTSPRRRRPRQ